MQIDIYNKFYQEYFVSENFKSNFDKALNTISKAKNIFFIGNGGSMAICSHMMEDYAKIGKFRTHAFSDPSLITCYANDYGYDNALKEWLKIYFEPKDLLVAISSSGNSQNIINGVSFAQEQGGQVIGLSGFKPDNKLNSSTDINFYLGIENYGVVECFHQVILHALLDEYAATNG